MQQPTRTNTDSLPRRRTGLPELALAMALFTASGALSTFLYYGLQRKGGVYFPGLIYTSATIIVFVLTKTKLATTRLLKYYISMLALYLVIWLLTMLSSWIVAFAGPVTVGLGAVGSFMLTDKFITKMNYKRVHVFLAGALPFVLTDILYLYFSHVNERPPFEQIFNVTLEPATLFLEAFLFWHMAVGIKLFLTLRSTAIPAQLSVPKERRNR